MRPSIIAAILAAAAVGTIAQADGDHGEAHAVLPSDAKDGIPADTDILSTAE